MQQFGTKVSQGMFAISRIFGICVMRSQFVSADKYGY